MHYGLAMILTSKLEYFGEKHILVEHGKKNRQSHHKLVIQMVNCLRMESF